MRSFIIAFLFCVSLYSHGAIGPQMKDFLCGCEHCETVDRGEPLDIASHMIRCHSWRKGMQKTMEIMEQTKKPKIKIIKKEKKQVVRERADSHVDIYNDYKWRQDEAYGWTYSTTYQSMNLKDMWRYLEDLGWVWSFGREKNFLYSESYGWLYLMSYKNERIAYWYDRRIWALLGSFKVN